MGRVLLRLQDLETVALKQLDLALLEVQNGSYCAGRGGRRRLARWWILVFKGKCSSGCAELCFLIVLCTGRDHRCCTRLEHEGVVTSHVGVFTEERCIGSVDDDGLGVYVGHERCGPLRDLLSFRFSRQPLFHGHSVDVTGQPTNRRTDSFAPSGCPSPRRTCHCCGSSTTVRTMRRPTHGVVSSAASVDVCLGFAADLSHVLTCSNRWHPELPTSAVWSVR